MEPPFPAGGALLSRSYWLSISPFNMKHCTSAKGCFEIPLKTQANTNQWNLIGYPFWAVSSLSNARVVTDSGVCATGCGLDTAQSQGIIQNLLWY